MSILIKKERLRLTKNALFKLKMQKTALFQYSSNPYSQSVTATLCKPPFGMLIKERSYTSDSYRFGFQSQEKDDEINGEGNSYAFKYRIHDVRLGRFLSVDPLGTSFPWNSSYSFSQNRVIDGMEFEGLEVVLSKEFDKNFKPAFRLFKKTKIAQDLLNRFAHFQKDDNPGDYFLTKGQEKGDMYDVKLSFTTGFISGGLAQTDVLVNGKNIKEFVFSVEEFKNNPTFEIVVTMNLEEAMRGYVDEKNKDEQIICQCYSAVILNHEAFLWVNMIADNIKKFNAGNLTELQLYEKLTQASGVRYGNIFIENSSLRIAHMELLTSIANAAIPIPKTVEDVAKNIEIKDYLKDMKRALVDEMNNTAKAYGTEAKHKEEISIETKKIDKLIDGIKTEIQEE